MLNAQGQERCLQGYGGEVRKREGNSLLKRPKRRSEDDIEMDLNLLKPNDIYIYIYIYVALQH